MGLMGLMSSAALLPEEAVKTVRKLLTVVATDTLHVQDRKAALQHALILKGDPGAGVAGIAENDLTEIARLVAPIDDRVHIARWVNQAGYNADGMTMAEATKHVADERRLRERLAVVVDVEQSQADRLTAIREAQECLLASHPLRIRSPEELLGDVRPGTDSRLHSVEHGHERRTVNRPPMEIFDVWKTEARG